MARQTMAAGAASCRFNRSRTWHNTSFLIPLLTWTAAACASPLTSRHVAHWLSVCATLPSRRRANASILQNLLDASDNKHAHISRADRDETNKFQSDRQSLSANCPALRHRTPATIGLVLPQVSPQRGHLLVLLSRTRLHKSTRRASAFKATHSNNRLDLKKPLLCLSLRTPGHGFFAPPPSRATSANRQGWGARNAPLRRGSHREEPDTMRWTWKRKRST